MTKKKTVRQEITTEEARVIEQLRRQPEMMERFQTILGLTNDSEGPLKTADEVEGLFMEEMRRLGHTSMTQWAVRAEQRVSAELQKEDPSVLKRKKKR